MKKIIALLGLISLSNVKAMTWSSPEAKAKAAASATSSSDQESKRSVAQSLDDTDEPTIYRLQMSKLEKSPILQEIEVPFNLLQNSNFFKTLVEEDKEVRTIPVLQSSLYGISLIQFKAILELIENNSYSPVCRAKALITYLASKSKEEIVDLCNLANYFDIESLLKTTLEKLEKLTKIHFDDISFRIKLRVLPVALQRSITPLRILSHPASTSLLAAKLPAVSSFSTLTGHTSDVNSVSWSPDGTRLASCSDDHTVRLWNVETGTPIGAPLAGHAARVKSVSWSPDGTRLASASADHTVRLWNAATGAQIGDPLRGHAHWVNSVSWSPDGTRLASGSYDQTVRLWDARTGTQLGAPFTGHTSEIYSAQWSPDGIRLASCSLDCTVRLWDARAGTQIGTPLAGHEGWIDSVSWSPDGTRLASCSQDGTVRLWDARAGTQIGTPLTGHAGWINSVSWSPDGTRLASCSQDGTVRLWNAATGTQIGDPLRGHTHWVNSVSWSPDGTRLASSSDDKTVRIWDLKELLATEKKLCSLSIDEAEALLKMPSSSPGQIKMRKENKIRKEKEKRCKGAVVTALAAVAFGAYKYFAEK